MYLQPHSSPAESSDREHSQEIVYYIYPARDVAQFATVATALTAGITPVPQTYHSKTPTLEERNPLILPGIRHVCDLQKLPEVR